MTPTRERRVLVLNGANLDLLGRREPEVYGRTTLADVDAGLQVLGRELGLRVELRQTNHEGVLVDWIHEAMAGVVGLVVNPAGWSHTSVVVRDALAALAVPVVEVHLSNIHAREEFRHHSYVSAVAAAVIVGAGADGYTLALRHLAHLLGSRAGD